jgi:histidinol-phosphate aminotransferase
MPQSLSANQHESFLTRGFSRRQLGRIAGVLSAGAALPFYNEAAYAQRAMRDRGEMPAGAVRINSNENPLGPCPEALQAICAVAKFGGRYSPHDEQGELTRTVAAVEDLKPEYISIFAGSSDPLLRIACAYTSPTRSWIMGDPGYESGRSTAEFIGAKGYHVPLRADHTHDVQAMVKRDSNAGVIYICNPNNPTGTVTPRADIDYAVANMPKGCILLVDEAYLHFSTSAHTVTDLVRSGKDVIILRTFSKIYGMAGIRAGMAIARPDLLEKLKPYGPGFVPITAMAAATASLKVKDLVVSRRKINTDIRENTFEFLDKKGYKFTKSEANHFMVDVRRPAADVVAALGKENVIIGRTWPVWPNHVRISVGTQAEMDKFKAAFAKVMA